MTDRIPCTECGALILPDTAERTDGLCMPCKLGRRKPKKVLKPRITTRKPAGELHPIDYETYPMWTYVHDEEKYDETFVKPLREKAVPAESVTWVSARIITAAGREFDGCAEISTINGTAECDDLAVFAKGDLLEIMPPEILVRPGPNEGGVSFEDVNLHVKRHRVALEGALGAAISEIYPITWELRVPLESNGDILMGKLQWRAV